jgi:hypothetical protein
MTSLMTTPPVLPPRRPLTWPELVEQERRLLDELARYWRGVSRRPLAEADEIVARALAEALQEIIAKEPDEERADELRRRAAARELARMFRKGPRLVYSRPLPIQKAKNKVAPATPVTGHNNKAKREIESFKAMLEERRRRRPHLVVDNAHPDPETCAAA